MPEIGIVGDFLQSISPISGYSFYIYDRIGKMLFSTHTEGDLNLPPSSMNTVLRVIKEETFCYDEKYSAGAIPIVSNRGIWGVLLAVYTEQNDTTVKGTNKIHNPRKIEAFLYHTSAIIEENITFREEISEMAEELDQSFSDLNLYSRITTQIKSLIFSESMLKNLINDIMSDMRTDFAFSVFKDPVKKNFKTMTRNAEEKLKNTDSFIQSLYKTLEPLNAQCKENFFIINDSSREDDFFRTIHPDPFRFLAVKVHHKEHVYGWMGFVSFNMQEMFRRGELRLLISVAEQLAIVIANSELYHDLENFIINMVKSLIIAIDAKDIYTRGHSERVARYSEMIGDRFNLTIEKKKELRWASILHDIGKIGIPENILNKKGFLSDEEYEIIRQHPGKGAAILKPVEQLEGAIPAIVHHHERFDGNGYPDGLKGEEIPFFSRIIAVADTFDAINSTRSYRSAKNKRESLNILLAISGSQLDPEVVNVFKDICEEILIPEEESHGQPENH